MFRPFHILPLLALALAAQTPSASGQVGEQSVENAFPELSFEQPVFLTHAGDGSDRLFVVEQAGRIMVFYNDPGAAEAGVLLDIRERVEDGHMEQGLLGLAFDPEFADNGYFYVHYTALPDGDSVISRFSVSPPEENVADPDSELVILEKPQPAGNHNGGMIGFGPDGYLYVAFGDGGNIGSPRDPDGHGQDPGTLHGTITRIDVSQATPEEPYRVPEDNPYVGRADARPEVWAYGLRNPWRFSFDEQGNLWVGDVGQNDWEEVNIVEPGKNYGWSELEGPDCFVESPSCDAEDTELPIYAYFPYDEGCAVTGGYVYRGYQVGALRDMYVFGDWCSGRVFALHYDGTGMAEAERLIDWWGDIMISSFGEDERGELYMVDHAGGSIYRFAANDPYLPEATLPEATPIPSGGATPSPDATPLPGPTGTEPAPTPTVAASGNGGGNDAADHAPARSTNGGLLAGGAAALVGGAALAFWMVRRNR